MSKYRICNNGDILPTISRCPPQSSRSHYHYLYYEESLSSPPYTPITRRLAGNDDSKSSIPFPVVLFLVFWVLMMALWVLCFIKACTNSFLSAVQGPPNRSASPISENDQRLHPVNETEVGTFSIHPESRTSENEETLQSVTNQAQKVTFRFGESGLDEKLVRLLPALRYRRCMSNAMAQDHLRAGLLQSYEGRKVEKQDKLMGDTQNSHSECAICVSPFLEQQRIRILPTCGHLFHVSCIDMWLQSHTYCQVCRQNLMLPLIQKFLSSLINDSPADNGGFLVLAGVENAVDVPSTSAEPYHELCTPSVLEHPSQQHLPAPPLCNLSTANQTVHFQIDGCHVLDVQGLPECVE